MSKLTEWMDTSLYGEFKRNWDDQLFRRQLLERINAKTVCLDYGAGRGNVKQMNFKGIAQFVAGIDPEPQVLDNPYLDDAKVFDLRTNTIPYEDEAFDVVFADNVMEHVQDPALVFKEIHRVLKPGGLFMAKTPNKWHYMPIVARSTPTWFHRLYNRMRGRDVIDTFPTRYRCNTSAAVRFHATSSGLTVRRIEFIEGRPEYLRVSALTYLLGYLYERMVNASRRLAALRCVMIFELEKRA